MSGGHFEYMQYQISQIADNIDQIIEDNNKEPDEYDYCGWGFSEETLDKLKEGQTYVEKLIYSPKE